MAGRLGAGPFADRLRASAARLTGEVETHDRAILGLQTAADQVELRRAEKRLGSLRSIVLPPPEVTETIEALARLRSAFQGAAIRLEVVKSQRASALGSLRRLHGAARRLAAARSDAAALADFEAACQDAVAEGDTAIATDPDTKAAGDPS